jgi:glycosyltransferase involved in cell wall biosynthesis
MNQPADSGDGVGLGEPGMLSVVMPAHNEEGNLATVVPALVAALDEADVTHEILVVNDNSTDGTPGELAALEAAHPTVRHIDNVPPGGFGLATARRARCLRRRCCRHRHGRWL